MAQLSLDQLSIVESEQRLLDALRAAADGQPTRPDPRNPYFAHLRIRDRAGERDLLLGFATLVDRRRGVRVLDWRTAPLAEVFFNHQVGEIYEQEVDARVLEGEVLDRRVVSFAEGELASILTEELLLTRGAHGWSAVAAPGPTRLDGGQGEPMARRWEQDGEGRKIPVVTHLLDEQQRDALQRDVRRPLLVLGGAGSGKTTVALHRLAWLHHEDPGRFGQRSMLVVVPEEGLARLTRAILAELGLSDVQVLTFDRWIAGQARRLFRDLPERESPDTPGLVVKLKRHPALRDLLPDFVRKTIHEMARRLDRKLVARGALADLDPGSDTPLAWLDQAEQRALDSSPPSLTREVRQLFAAERRRLYEAHEDLLQLFGDADLLGRVAQASSGELSDSAVSEVLRHTRRQLAETSDEVFAHVDEDRRQTVDGRGLDEGTPEETAGTVDPEDYAVSLELLRLKTDNLRTPRAALSRYSHVVIDEAQELAPIELGVLGRALQGKATVTVCGDQAQQIDPSSCFSSWERALADLGARHAEAVHLRTSYRCTAPVTRFAHHVLGPLAPTEMPRPSRDGAPVLRSSFPTEAHAALALVQALQDLGRREPSATVALIAPDEAGARRAHGVIARSLEARLVLRGAFTFTPGIDVTTVSQVKGLEFDVVVVLDATARSYPDTPGARRQLHVACTRAIHQLWLIHVGTPSPVLP